FPSNLGQTAEQIVGIEDRKAAGAFGERGKDLLVGAYRRRKLWNDGAGLGKDVIRVGVVWIEAAGSRAGAARAARGTAAGSAGAARAAFAPGSAGAAPATSCPTAACSATAAANGPAAASYRRSSPAAGPLRIGRKNKARASQALIVGMDCRFPPPISGHSDFRCRNGRHQPACVQRIDGYIGFIASINGRR